MCCFSFQYPQAGDEQPSDRAECLDDGPTMQHLLETAATDRVKGARHDADAARDEQPDRGVDGAVWPDDGDRRRQPVNEEQGSREDKPTGHESVGDPARTVASEPPMGFITKRHSGHQGQERPGRGVEPAQCG